MSGSASRARSQHLSLCGRWSNTSATSESASGWPCVKSSTLWCRPLRDARRPQERACLVRRQVAQRHHPQQLPPPRVLQPPPARRIATRHHHQASRPPSPGRKSLAHPPVQARGRLIGIKQQHPPPARPQRRHGRRAIGHPHRAGHRRQEARRRHLDTAQIYPPRGHPGRLRRLRKRRQQRRLADPARPIHEQHTPRRPRTLHRRPEQLQLARPTHKPTPPRRAAAAPPASAAAPPHCSCLESTNLPRRESKFSRPRRQPPPSRQHARTTERRPRPFQPRTRSRRSPPRVRRLPSA